LVPRNLFRWRQRPQRGQQPLGDHLGTRVEGSNPHERGFRVAEPGGITPETSDLLRKVMISSTSEVSVPEAARALDLYHFDVREFTRDRAEAT
jgi:hypothetical protein